MEQKFSFFRPPITTNQTPEGESWTLKQVSDYISGERAKTRTENLRKTGDSSLKKTTLDFVTFGGVFDYRNISDKDKLSQMNKRGLISPSGLLTIDIDHVSQIGRDLLELELDLLKDRELGLRLIFISPRGDGLKLVCNSLWGVSSPEEYKSEYYSLLGYLHDTHKIPYVIKVPGGKDIDILDLTTDITRTCFLCYDPESVLVVEGTEYYSPGFNSDEHYYTEDEIREEKDRESGREVRKRETIRPQGVSSSDWGSFVEGRLLPAMFDRIDEIFPDMNFHLSGGVWKSPLKLDGTPAKTPRRDKSVITSRRPDKILEQGGETLGVIDYYMTKTGLSFPEARKELSRICGLQEEELELRRKTAQDQNNDQIKPRTMQDKETPTGGEKVPEIGKYARLFELPQKGDLWKELSRDPEGFKTSFYFGEGKDREVLTIPREGVTYICGLSSHFKSTLLRNLALQMTEDDSQVKGDVLFFSLEESPRKTKLRLLCAYSNSFFNKAREYAKSRDLLDISINPDFQRDFISKTDDFESFLTSGKLRLFDYPENVHEIVEFLEMYRERRPIKAVFIDFIQRLKAGRTPSRTDEMRVIAETLQNFSKRQIGERKLPGEPIPVIVAAQLNRQTPSPIRMGANNIAESADLTRYAETIICLWGSQKTEDVTDVTFPGSKEESRLRELGFTLGTPGTIYAKITKNKEGESGLEGILNVEGGSGRISQEESKTEKKNSTIWGK